MAGSTDDGARNPILDWLERWGWSGIPHGAIPPADPIIEDARREARSVAAASGRLDHVAAVQHEVAAVALQGYADAGFRYAYFVGSVETLDHRMEAIELLIDAATAYELQDLLPEWATVSLLARFDVYHGGRMLFADETSDQST